MWTHRSTPDREIVGETPDSVEAAVMQLIERGTRIPLVNTACESAGHVLRFDDDKIVTEVEGGAIRRATLTVATPSDTELQQETVWRLRDPVGPAWDALASYLH